MNPVLSHIIAGGTGAMFGFGFAVLFARNSWADGFRAGFHGRRIDAENDPECQAFQPGVAHAQLHRNVRREATTLWHPEDAPLVARLDEAGKWSAVDPEDLREAEEQVNAHGGIVWAIAITIAAVAGLLWFANSVFEKEETVTRLRSEAATYNLQNATEDKGWKR